MKKIVCEMCGSNDFVKKEGFFCCENCGTKYTVEEARKMMIEGTVEVTGTVSIDTSKKDSALLEVIKTAMDSRNYSEVYELSSQLLTNNATFWEAWFYKGAAACFVSADKYQETLTCFDKAYSICPDDKKESLKGKIVDSVVTVSEALVKHYCDIFQNNPSGNNAGKLMDNLGNSLEGIRSLQKKYNYSYVGIHNIEDHFVIYVYDSLNAAKQLADSKFGRDASDRTDYKFDIYIDEVDSIIAAMSVILNNYSLRPESVEPYMRFFQKCIRSTTHASSYVWSVGRGKYVESKCLTRNAVRERNKMWEDTYAKKDRLVKLGQEREMVYHKIKNKEYWEAHYEEYHKLCSDLEELKKQRQPYTDEIDEIDKEINSTKESGSAKLQEELDLEEINEKIASTKQKISEKGLFDFKGKKPLKDELNILNKSYKSIYKKAKDARKAVDDITTSKLSTLNVKKNKVLERCSDIDSKIKTINNELTKNR